MLQVLYCTALYCTVLHCTVLSRGGERAWWRRALRDPRVVRDGFLVIVAGPEVFPDYQQSDLVEVQLAELSNQAEELVVPQLSLQTCINQRR